MKRTTINDDVKMNKWDTCAYYQPKILYCELYSLGEETAEILRPYCRNKNEEMQEVANRDAFYGEALND